LLFEQLNIIEPIQRALKQEGYTEATPIQLQAINPLLEGHDCLGCAQTGTGKTAAFAIPILQKINQNKKEHQGKRQIRALILAPTRELAIQIDDSFKAYGRFLRTRSLVVYGGVSQNPQTRSLNQGIDILVATPGRLLDLIQQKFIDLRYVEHFVLDEADMMLDMGMIQDVKKIIAYIPKDRQTLLFSATMPEAIMELAHSILKNPIRIDLTPKEKAIHLVNQTVYFVDKNNKMALLISLLSDKKLESVLIFSRTKHGADRIVKLLGMANHKSQAIHGNKSQNARQFALNNFKSKKIRVLVATDIAARGIDIEELSHVINFDLPEVAETYVHRIGRTGRAGLSGQAISFCSHSEKALLQSIEKLMNKKIVVINNHSYPLKDVTEEPTKTINRGRPIQRQRGPISKDSKQIPKRNFAKKKPKHFGSSTKV